MVFTVAMIISPLVDAARCRHVPTEVREQIKAAAQRHWIPRSSARYVQTQVPKKICVPVPKHISLAHGAGKSADCALSLVRLIRRPTDAIIEKLEIQACKIVSPRRFGPLTHTPAISAYHASISHEAFTRIVTLAQAALRSKWTVRREERAKFIHGRFEHYVELSGNHLPARRFSGYRGATQAAPETLPLAIIEEAVRHVEKGAGFKRVPLSEPFRQFFVAQFLQAAPAFDQKFYGWVRDRFISASGYLGNKATMVTVAHYLDPRLGRVKSDTREQQWLQRLAVTAVAALTGKDLRWSKSGHPRPLADVVKDYRKMLRKGVTLQPPPLAKIAAATTFRPKERDRPLNAATLARPVDELTENAEEPPVACSGICRSDERCTVDLRRCSDFDHGIHWVDDQYAVGILQLKTKNDITGWQCVASKGNATKGWAVLADDSYCWKVEPRCCCSKRDSCDY